MDSKGIVLMSGEVDTKMIVSVLQISQCVCVWFVCVCVFWGVL